MISEWIQKGKKEGFSTKSLILPAALVIVLMQLLMTANTVYIDILSQRATLQRQWEDTIGETFASLEEDVELQGNRTALFVNTGYAQYLEDYLACAQEMGDLLGQATGDMNGREQELVERQMEQIPDLFARRAETETHALLLTAEAWQVPLPEDSGLSQETLSAEERAMSGEQQLRAAADLLGSESTYRQDGVLLGELLNKAGARVSSYSRTRISTITVALNRQRTIQWILTGVNLVVLALMCILLFRWLLRPLEVCIQRVQAGEKIPEWEGTRELRNLAVTYNRILKTRNLLEGNLRSLSQTDALTNLPNRLAFENYVSQLSLEQPESSLTVFSLDVNGLKQVNDTLGHVYGDELLRKAAACILETFSDGSGKNCFRFGGDEFAAFWIDTPYEEVENALERFRRAQACRDVSIAVGYAYTSRLELTTVDALYQQADAQMYHCKAEQKRSAPPKL